MINQGADLLIEFRVNVRDPFREEVELRAASMESFVVPRSPTVKVGELCVSQQLHGQLDNVVHGFELCKWNYVDI